MLLHGGQSSISLEYQTYTSAHLFDTLVTVMPIPSHVIWAGPPKIMLGNSPLACVVIDFGSKWGVLTCFHGEKLVLPIFPAPGVVDNLDCEYHDPAGSTKKTWSRALVTQYLIACWMI